MGTTNATADVLRLNHYHYSTCCYDVVFIDCSLVSRNLLASIIDPTNYSCYSDYSGYYFGPS